LHDGNKIKTKSKKLGLALAKLKFLIHSSSLLLHIIPCDH
jgi:hypothetical protein